MLFEFPKTRMSLPSEIDGDLSERASVLEILEKAPALLAYRATIVAQKDAAHRRAKHEVEIQKAMARIVHKEERNAELIKAHCDNEAEVKTAVRAEIRTRTDLEIARIEHHRVDDLFISARKVASMDGRELAALRGSTVAGSAVKDDSGNIIDASTGEVMG